MAWLDTFCSVNEHLPLLVLPVVRHWAILRQIIVVVEVLLVLHYGHEHLKNRRLDRLANPCEAKHLLEDLVGDLFGRNLGVEHVLLEESVLSVHVGAIEEAIPIDYIIHEVLPANVDLVIVIFTLDIVLVTSNVPLLYRLSFRQGFSRSTSCLEPQRSVLALSDLFSRICCLLISGFLFVSAILVEGLLQFAEALIEVDVNVGSTNLDK